MYYVKTKKHAQYTNGMQRAREDAIYKCYQAAKNRGFHFRTADGVHQVLQLTRQYDKYGGKSDKCGADGKGGPWAKQLFPHM